MVEIKINKAKLYYLYIVEEKSSTEVGNELGCNWATVISRLRKYGILVRKQGLNTQRLRDKISKERMGKNNPHQVCSEEHKEAVRKFWTGKKCPNKSMPGEKNPAWKGGISSEFSRISKTDAYKEWRTSVFERDNYACQRCLDRSGSGKAVKLHAHHIIPFVLALEERLNLDNGATLCQHCHMAVHQNEYRVGCHG